ncbi:MAG: hypothetical protein C4293_09895 [Nitrospiraceae bacterium]
MPASDVTRSLGGKTKPIPMTVTPTDRQITDKDLQAFVGDGKTGPPADLLSAFCPHEQAVRTCIPASPTRHSSEEWRQKYQKFGEETTQHIEVLHGLIQHPGLAEKMPDSETKQAIQSALQQLSARKINTLTGRNRPGSERC